MHMRCLMFALSLSMLAWAVPGVAPAQDAAAASSTPAPVAEPASPYDVTVPVADTSAARRGEAFTTALGKVLAHEAGHPFTAAQIAAIPGKASAYVRQYQYRHAAAGSPQPFDLIVHFAPSSIHYLARSLEAAGSGSAGNDTDTGVAGIPGQAMGGDSTVWVEGVHSALGFADVLDALRNAPAVDRVSVQAARGDGMLLDVHTSAPLSQVLPGLERGGRFTASASAHAGADASLRWHR